MYNFKGYSFSFQSFCNFVRILSFSLYKGCLGDEEKLSYELATVLKSTFCYEMHQRTPDDVPPAVLWLIIGCKGNHSISIKQI